MKKNEVYASTYLNQSLGFSVGVLYHLRLAAESVASFAQNIATSLAAEGPYLAGSVYRAIPDGLSDAYIAYSNNWMCVSETAEFASKAATAVAVVLVAVDIAISLNENFSNDDLSLNQQISYSALDIAFAILPLAAGILIPGIGGAIASLVIWYLWEEVLEDPMKNSIS
ncbi:MAG: hypothetical protein AB7U79_04395 [Candidatus Izemoplasmatales bacterium]